MGFEVYHDPASEQLQVLDFEEAATNTKLHSEANNYSMFDISLAFVYITAAVLWFSVVFYVIFSHQIERHLSVFLSKQRKQSGIRDHKYRTYQRYGFDGGVSLSTVFERRSR